MQPNRQSIWILLMRVLSDVPDSCEKKKLNQWLGRLLIGCGAGYDRAFQESDYRKEGQAVAWREKENSASTKPKSATDTTITKV